MNRSIAAKEGKINQKKVRCAMRAFGSKYGGGTGEAPKGFTQICGRFYCKKPFSFAAAV